MTRKLYYKKIRTETNMHNSKYYKGTYNYYIKTTTKKPIYLRKKKLTKKTQI